MVKKRPKKSGSSKKSRGSPKSGNTSTVDFKSGDEGIAATETFQKQVDEVTEDKVQELTGQVSSEKIDDEKHTASQYFVEKIKEIKDSDNDAIKSENGLTLDDDTVNDGEEKLIDQVKNSLSLKCNRSEKLFPRKIKEPTNLSKVSKKPSKKPMSTKKSSDPLKSGSTDDIGTESVEAVETETVQTEATEKSSEVEELIKQDTFAESDDKVIQEKTEQTSKASEDFLKWKSTSACNIGTGSPQTVTTETVQEQDEEKLKRNKEKVDEIINNLSMAVEKIDRAEKQPPDHATVNVADVVTLEDFQKALTTVQKKDLKEDTAMEMITNIESDKIVIPKDKLERINSSDGGNVPTTNLLEIASVTLHPIDDCPVYSKLVKQIKRVKYPVCCPVREGYCDACEMSTYSWSKIVQTNIFANALMAYTGKAPLNRLVFPDEESPPNSGGSFMEPRYDIDKLEYFNLYNGEEYSAKHGRRSEQKRIVQNPTPVTLQELFAMFEYSIRGIYNGLKITKDIYFPLADRPRLEPIIEEDEEKDQTNVGDKEILANLKSVEETRKEIEGTVTDREPAEQKSLKIVPKKRKLKHKKPTFLPPMRVRVPAMNYIQLRTHPGAEPLYTVTFGHIMINIYNQQELAHAQRYHEEYLNSLIPDSPPKSIPSASADQSPVDENIEIEEEEEEK